MIADYADKLNTYEEFKDYADMVQQFIKKQKEENLPEGRYDLKNGIFALVQKYTTKSLDGAQMESHKKYCDLQYIVEGTEKIYWASLRKLTVEDDRTPEADIIFYKSGPEQGYTLLEAGMFGFYAPEDGHMPCIAVTEAQPATKIVFKIPVFLEDTLHKLAFTSMKMQPKVVTPGSTRPSHTADKRSQRGGITARQPWWM